MRKRNIKKQIWLNMNEAEMLKKKSKKAGLKEAVYMRNLILGYEPKEKPDDRFYDVMKDIRAIGNNLNQIATKANAVGFIDVNKYKEETKKLSAFMVQVKKKFLLNTGE